MAARAAAWRWEGFHDDHSGGTQTETVRVRGEPLCRCYTDFEKYGQDCMANDCVTQTEFGLLRRLDPPFPEQRQGLRMM